MKRIFLLTVLVLVAFMCKPAPAQEEFYEISWDLNKDGVTYEYLMFIAFTSDSNDIPFNDSLFNFPDSQWSQFLIFRLKHDSIAVINADRGYVEYTTQRDPDNPNALMEYYGICIFARSTDGYYSDRSVLGPVQVPTYIRPDQVNQAGIMVTRKTRWK